MQVRGLVGLAMLGVGLLPVSATAAPVRLELTAPARVAAGDAFTIDVRAPGAGRVGAFSASVGYARNAASISAALPLVRGGFPVGGEDGRVGFYGASGIAPRSRPLGVISFEPSRTGVFRIRIAQATLYDPAGKLIARAKATTLTVRVGRDRTVLSGRAPSLAGGGRGVGRLLASAGAASPHGQAGVAAAYFARGQVGMGRVQALAARATSAPRVRRQLAATTATWTVNTTADLPDASPGNGVCGTSIGLCSLRAAVTESNAHVGPDVINFSVAATSGIYSVFSLTNGGSLSLTDGSGGTTIDGYTQPGSSPNTDPTLSNARNLIYIDSANGNPRFIVTGGSNVFRGLAFSSRGTAIDFEAGGNYDRVVGNWFGFTTTGANMSSGNYAVMLNSATGNVIGTPALADRNVFGNYGYGTHSEGYTTTNTVQNNLIGITPSGGPSSIGCTGTDWNAGAHSNQIGGLGVNQANHYASGGCEAIELSHGYTSSGAPPGGEDRWNNEYNNIQGNTTGLDAFGRYAGGAYLSAGNGDNLATRSVTASLYEADCINVYDHSPSNLIEGNRCMPQRAGISTGMTSTRETFRNNIIGVDVDGLTPRSGYDFGFILRRSSQFDTVTGNTIAGAKVAVTMESVGDYSDTVQANHFYNISNMLVDLDNGDNVLGTPLPNDPGDADVGANRKQNYPVVTVMTTSRISGTSEANGGKVEVYAQNPTTGWIDPVGTATVSSGTWSVQGISLAVGQRIYAMQTAAAPQLDSSECPFAGTVTAGTQAPSTATDSFTRTVTGGFGNADAGGPWGVNSAASFSVNGSEGIASGTAGATREASLDGVVAANPNLAATVRFPVLPTGSGADVSAYLSVRRNGTSAYRGRLRVDTAGRAYATIIAVVNGAETIIAGPVAITGLTIASGGQARMRLAATGTSPTTLGLRVWNVGAAEPAPQLSASNSAAGLQTAGSVALRSWASSRVANGPLQVVWDDVSLQ